jgi:hypothetical protein
MPQRGKREMEGKHQRLTGYGFIEKSSPRGDDLLRGEVDHCIPFGPLQVNGV